MNFLQNKCLRNWVCILGGVLLPWPGQIDVSAQDKSTHPSRWYFNVDKNLVALDGYDVVSYQSGKKPLRGNPRWEAKHGGIIYRFANEANLMQFKKSPDTFLPEFGGWCAFLMGVDPQSGQPPRRFKPDPTHFKIVDQKLYLFLKRPNIDGKTRWEANSKSMIKHGNTFWKSRVALAKKYSMKPQGLHPMARLETLQFQFFIGQWESKYKVRTSIKQPGYSPEIQGQWKAWYGWEGFAIYDDWKQVGVPGGNSGPAIRSFDPFNNQWVMHFIPINAPLESVWAMTGKFNEKGELHATMKGKDASGQFLQKVHFINISKDHFSWRSDRSYDKGKTWIKDWGVGENYRVKTSQSKKR